MATIEELAERVEGLARQLSAHRRRLEHMEQGLRQFLPQPNPTLSTHDKAAPQPVERTTVVNGPHPDWSGQGR